MVGLIYYLLRYSEHGFQASKPHKLLTTGTYRLNQSKILEKLQHKYKGHSNLAKNFYRSLPDNG